MSKFKLEYTKIRRTFLVLFVAYVSFQTVYTFSSLNSSNDKISRIQVINNHILNDLAEINKNFISANKLYYLFETERVENLLQIVEFMNSTITKGQSLKDFIIENNVEVDLTDIDVLITNAKLIKMTAFNYHTSWLRTRTGGSTIEMEEALHAATDKPIWTSFDMIQHIRNHVEHYAQEAVLKINSQKNIIFILVVVQVIAFLLVATLLSKILSWHINRLLRMASLIAEGKFDERIEVIGKDCVAQLAIAVNRSAKKLGVLHEALEQERKKAERESEAKSKFLSNLSHEIRTPLNCISGFSELVTETSSIDDAKANASMVLHESRHLLSLVNTILDHAKIESGKLTLENEIFDLYENLEQSGNILKSLIKDKVISVDINIANDVPHYICSDSLRFNQIIRNLFSNAAKFTEKGLIKLEISVCTLRSHKVKLLFTVSDTGIGIPADKLDSIFEGFTQADDSITRKFGGTGLGTTITKELVQLFGSELSVRSVENVGTSFRFAIEFDLPTESEIDLFIEKKQMNKSIIDNVAKVKGSVLVVDDYLPNQTLFKAFLASDGIDCEIAQDGQEALALCMEKSYSVIFIDVQMPKMNGFDATKAIRKNSNSKNAYIVGVSGDISSESNLKCLSVGMNLVLNKPVKKNEFLNSIPRL